MASVSDTGMECLKIELSQMGLAHPDENVIREFVERDQTFVRELNSLYSTADRDRHLSEASRSKFFDLIGHYYVRDRWPTPAHGQEYTAQFLSELTRAMRADGWMLVEEPETATTH